jgi:hypothetical protein
MIKEVPHTVFAKLASLEKAVLSSALALERMEGHAVAKAAALSMRVVLQCASAPMVSWVATAASNAQPTSMAMYAQA